VQLGAENGKVFGLAGDHHFYVSAVCIANPAMEIQLGGFAMNEPAKTDSLNSPADKEMKNHVECLVSQRLRGEARWQA
jgi:hypothetical protein